MPTPVDHALFVLLAVFFPIRSATFGWRRLRDAPPARVTEVRNSLYRQAILVQWTFTLGTLAFWLAQRRPLDALGLTWRTHTWSLAIAAGCALLIGYLAVSLRRVLADPETLLKIRRRIEPIERIMPRTGTELRFFYLLSLTAGICEEILYRGYLFWYLAHALPPVWCVPVAALLFGVGHSYQGRRGMVSTALAGVVLGTIYLLTGSLVLPMVLHALMDVWSGTIGRAAIRAAEGEPYESTGIAAADSEPLDGGGTSPPPSAPTA